MMLVGSLKTSISGLRIVHPLQRNFVTKTANLFRSSSAIQSEKRDLDILSGLSNHLRCLQHALPDSKSVSINPLYDIEKARDDVKDVLQRDFGSLNIGQLFDVLGGVISSSYSIPKEDIEYLSMNSPQSTSVDENAISAFLRFEFFKEYMKTMSKYVKEGDLPESEITKEKLMNLVDIVFMGNSDSRVSEHLQLFGNEVTQFQFQMAFHALYEPEINVASTLIGYQKEMSKIHKKNLPKYSKTYLLDSIELNTKARSVFCWSDPEFRGFIPPADEVTMPMPRLIESRLKYFSDGSEMAYKFASDYFIHYRAKVEEKQQFRESMVKGVLFFTGTCILDYVVSTM